MSQQIEQAIERYYDTHPLEEEWMGNSVIHGKLIDYLVAVLEWLFGGRLCAICHEVGFYRTPDKHERPIVPDIAVIKGEPLHLVNSWYVGVTGPAPQVVFEILSEGTWEADLDSKPAIYARLGVQEYFVYDPQLVPFDKEGARRLFGWRRDQVRGELVKLVPDESGRLWSEELESWLVPHGRYLRLTDRSRHRRLTGQEAEERAKRRALLQAEEERRRAEVERKRAETEAEAKRLALLQAEEERKRAEAAGKRAEALAEKLRALGIDPEGM